MTSTRFSVIIPAHNEEVLLPRGLAAIADAASRVEEGVEVIVVDNRCTDSTAAIAEAASHVDSGRGVEVIVVDNRCTDATAAIAAAACATVVRSEARNIAAVRNAGAAAATGDVIVTIDADSVMAPTALADIDRHLATGRCIGGGAKIVPERSSAGIRATLALVQLMVHVTRVSGGMFWCNRVDFEAIGGFDEGLVIAEDVEFARRLRKHGRRTGRPRFLQLRSAPLVISTRKFDRFGDWHMFAMVLQAREIRQTLKGTNTAWADRYFFDFNDGTG